MLLLDLICNGAPAIPPDQHESRQEAQEAALSCLLAALMGHPHNCRVLLSLGIDQLIDMAARKSTHTHNRKLVFDILQLLGPYSYVECTNCGKRQPQGDICSQCGRAVFISLAKR